MTIDSYFLDDPAFGRSMKLDPQTKIEVLTGIAQNKSVSKLADKFDLHPKTIAGWRYKHYNDPRLKKEVQRRFHEEGRSIANIGAALCVRTAIVALWIRPDLDEFDAEDQIYARVVGTDDPHLKLPLLVKLTEGADPVALALNCGLEAATLTRWYKKLRQEARDHLQTLKPHQQIISAKEIWRWCYQTADKFASRT